MSNPKDTVQFTFPSNSVQLAQRVPPDIPCNPQRLGNQSTPRDPVSPSGALVNTLEVLGTPWGLFFPLEETWAVPGTSGPEVPRASATDPSLRRHRMDPRGPSHG